MYSFVRNQNTEHECFYIRSFAGLDSVEIIIRAKQKDLNGKVEIVEHKAQGSYGCKGGKHYIRYMDKHLSPKEQVPTVIKLGDRELTIIRQGLVSSRQSFILQGETRADYHTPYGTMELVMHTHELSSEFQENQGSIHLVYSLEANGAAVGLYDLEIRFTAT